MPAHIRFVPPPIFSDEKLRKESEILLKFYNQRRSLRFFSQKSVPSEVIENLLMIASSAPSGANKQPWIFCAVSDAHLKRQIRVAAEQEEYESYHGRMSKEWLEDLKQFGTDWNKPFLETAPWLVIVFKEVYGLNEDGGKTQNYYVNESVGIACGFLISAVHQLGLVTLTHTPSPMNFLTNILKRPANERPFLLLPVGYPAEGATVPEIKKKTPEQVIKWF